jgi:hypothetical protein
VTEAVEQVNTYFKSRLSALLGLIDDRGEIASVGRAMLPRPAPVRINLEDLDI